MYLSRLKRSVIITVVFLITVMTAIYLGFKYGDNSDLYRTHTEQYIHSISGIFLRGIAPASSILVIFAITLVFLFRSFQYELNIAIESKATQEEVVERGMLATFADFWKSTFFYVCAITIFMSVAFFLDIVYVISIPRLTRDETVIFQLALVFYDVIYKLFLPHFLSIIYKPYSLEYTRAYAIIQAMMDIVAPCVAVFVSDDLCFAWFFVHSNEANRISYSFSECYVFSVDRNLCEVTR